MWIDEAEKINIILLKRCCFPALCHTVHYWSTTVSKPNQDRSLLTMPSKKITNGNSRKALQAPSLSSAAQLDFTDIRKCRITTNNSLVKLSRHHSSWHTFSSPKVHQEVVSDGRAHLLQEWSQQKDLIHHLPVYWPRWKQRKVQNNSHNRHPSFMFVLTA